MYYWSHLWNLAESWFQECSYLFNHKYFCAHPWLVLAASKIPKKMETEIATETKCLWYKTATWFIKGFFGIMYVLLTY